MSFTSNSFPILVIIGPSGSGKSTAIRELTNQKLVEVISTWTTRPPRPDELENGIEHRFVSEGEFKKAHKAGFLLEVRQMFGLPYWYGLPKIDQTTNGPIPLIVLRESLINLFSKHYSKYIVYQIADTQQRVKERLEARKIHGEGIGLRLDNFERELELGHKVAKRTFINDSSADKLVNKLAQAILTDFPLNPT